MSEQTKRYSGPNLARAARSSPYPTHRLSAPISLVDTAQAIESASLQVTHRTNSQLRLIAQQIEFLQQQARTLLDHTYRDLALHRAECRFRKVIGEVYHLYRRPDGSTYFSMLSPGEFGGEPPDEFVDSYRLQPDQSWLSANEMPPPVS